MDRTEEEEVGCIAAGTVTAPEMTGDLLSTALSWAYALFIVNFNALA